MEQIMNYVKPELIVVAVALYFLGMALKQAQAVKDKYIPLILGGVSIVLCAIWVLATSEVGTGQQAAMAVFTAVTQGILVAGLSNYVNQIIKQTQKSEGGRPTTVPFCAGANLPGQGKYHENWQILYQQPEHLRRERSAVYCSPQHR